MLIIIYWSILFLFQEQHLFLNYKEIKKNPEINQGVGVVPTLQRRPHEKSTMFIKGGVRFLPRVNAKISFNIFQSAMTLDLFLLLLHENIYGINHT